MNRLQATESTSCKGTAVNAEKDEKENPCPQPVDKRRFAPTEGALES
jgi:hypothetical protein